MNPTLTDEQFERVKARLNGAIHEIVFACEHAENDSLDDAATCLVTVQLTIDQVAEELVAAEKGAER